MKKLVIEPHYLGCLEYFCLMDQFDEVLLEVNDSFQKQTYRNRFYILGANQVQSLQVPVSYNSRTPTSEVKIDYSQRWIKDHWGALYSSYGKAPFYEHFADHYKKVWDLKPDLLVDLCREMMNVSLKFMKLTPSILYTDVYEMKYSEDHFDLRNLIHPKIEFTSRNIYRPVAYSQLFGDRFVPNLSVLDLLMCEGPHSGEILRSSYVGNTDSGLA